MISSLLLALAPAFQSTCPEFSPQFGPAGVGGEVNDFALFDDGSGPALYMAGSFTTAGSIVAPGIVRWNGSSFSAVGAGIDVSAEATVNALRVLDLGAGPALYACGSFASAGGQPTHGIARFDGTTWDTLAGGPPPVPGESLPTIFAMAVFDEGFGPRLFAGGMATSLSNSSPVPYLARFDGSSWSFVPGSPNANCSNWDPNCWGQGIVLNLAVFDDGSGPALYVSGEFSAIGTHTAFNIARWNGGTWFVPGGTGIGGSTGVVTTMLVHDDGSGPALYVGGTLGGAPLQRWNGVAFTAVPAGGPTNVTRILSLPAVAGRPASLWALPYSAGYPTKSWDGTQWTTLTPPLTTTDQFPLALAAYDEGAGAQLFVGGRIHLASPISAANVARFDGANWSALASGAALEVTAVDVGWVDAVAIHDRGQGPELIAAGRFAAANGVELRDIARWDGAHWNAIGGMWPSGQFRGVRALASADVGAGSTLYLAGDLTLIINNNGTFWCFAQWNGSGQVVGLPGSPTTANQMGVDLELADLGAGPVLYATTDKTLYRWNGSTLTFVASTTGSIRDLQVHDDGTGRALYVSGRFTSIGGFNATNIARYNGTTWSAVGTGIPVASSDAVEVMTSIDDGMSRKLIAGGRFTSAGGNAVSNLAAWNGASWSSVGGGVGGTNAVVLSLAPHDDGQGNGPRLFVGGNFTSAGGAPASNLAAWDGSAWETSDLSTSGHSGSVRTIASLESAQLGGRVLAIGGEFDALGNLPSSKFALRSTCGQTGALFCIGDGSGTACPCGNTSAASERAGCAHSFGHGGALRASGRANLFDDTLVLTASAMTNASGTFYQGVTRNAGVAFGDGITCIGGPFLRLGSKFNAGGTSHYPELGDLSVSVRGGLLAPGTRHYAVRYRNAANFCTSDTFNYTNAVTIVWGL